MADSGGHQAAAANGGGDQAEAMAENGDNQAAAANGEDQTEGMEANGDNQAAAANGEDQAEGMEDNGDNQAAAANRGDQAEGMEANGAGGNGGGIPAQDEGSHAVDVAAEYWATGDVDAGARRPTALRRVAEEALYEVLLRMPAAEVARCSTVCRRLHDIISSEAFRRDHHRHSFRQPMPLFFYRLDHQVAQLDNPDLVRVHLRSVDIAARESRPVIRFVPADPALPIVDPRVFTIEGSCDGILLLSYHTRLYACNPCTRRWGRLPPLHVDNDIIGFYGNGPFNKREYRVLYNPKIQEPDCRYWIFSLSFPDQPVRYIGRPTNLEAIDLVLAHGIVPSYWLPPTTIEHRVHWRPQVAQDNSNVLMFDTIAEAFRWIPPPRQLEGTRWVEVEGDQLLEINGMLAMTLISQTLVDVWVLQEGEVWAHLYTILLPVAQLNIFGGYDDEDFVSATVLVVSQERDVLAQCPHIILQTDNGGNVLKFYTLAGHLTVLSRYTLQESLLMHAFLPMQQGDAIDGDPPFFQGP